MPVYCYHGRNGEGEAINGTVDKPDKNNVVDYLLQENITPVKIDLQTENKPLLDWLSIKDQLFHQKVSDEQLIMFCRQMYTITKSGIPLAQGINNLSISLSTGDLKQALNDIFLRLQFGMSLSMAMQRHPAVFDGLFINMVKVGENSGNLDTIFLQLSRYIERDLETRKAIKSATRYPTFVFSAMVVAIAIVNIFVIPAFTDMFQKFNADLPVMTRLLITLSDIFIHHWALLLIVSCSLLMAILYSVKTPFGRMHWDRQKLKIPIVGPLCVFWPS